MCYLVGILVAFGLTIASSIFLYAAIHDNASTQLMELKNATALAQSEFDAVLARLPATQMCGEQLGNNTLLIQNCSDIANAIIQADSELLANKTQILAQNTVQGFNQTVVAIIAAACERILVLEQEINATYAVPFDVQNGTVTVQLNGGDMFGVPYSVKQLKLNELRLIYLSLESWPFSLTTTTGQVDPVFKFTQFVPPIMQPGGPDLAKPLMVEQSERFSWSNVGIKAVSYLWNGTSSELVIQSVGNSSQFDSVALTEPLSVVMQFI